MIVDDDDDIRQTLAEVLSEQAFDCIVAADGVDALGRLENEKLPGVILLDLVMPNMNGWEFYGALRRNPLLANIPVIVMTVASARRDPIDAAHILEKPFTLESVLEVLSRACASP